MPAPVSEAGADARWFYKLLPTVRHPAPAPPSHSQPHAPKRTAEPFRQWQEQCDNGAQSQGNVLRGLNGFLL